jgi:hypothetical protein
LSEFHLFRTRNESRRAQIAIAKLEAHVIRK